MKCQPLGSQRAQRAGHCDQALGETAGPKAGAEQRDSRADRREGMAESPGVPWLGGLGGTSSGCFGVTVPWINGFVKIYS